MPSFGTFARHSAAPRFLYNGSILNDFLPVGLEEALISKYQWIADETLFTF
jgi:hypothetical protein